MTGAVVGGRAAAPFLEDVDRHMLELLATRSGPVVDAARAPIAAGGKRLRPLLVLAARPAALDTDEPGSTAFDACAIRAAAAVELVHTASLVHDDLLDDAAVRRGEPTVGALRGRDSATATGDLLFSLAFDTLVRCREHVDAARVQRAVRVLARASRTLAEGEALQARQLRDPHLAESAYLARCEMKTGVLFEASLQLGAILGDAALDDVDVLGRFGRTVGTAFQVADDVLDCGSPDEAARLGKLPGADLRDGTITLPMLRCVEAVPELATELAAPIARDRVEPILEVLRSSGALDSSRAFAHLLRADAEALLADLGDRYDVAALAQVAAASVERLS